MRLGYTPDILRRARNLTVREILARLDPYPGLKIESIFKCIMCADNCGFNEPTLGMKLLKYNLNYNTRDLVNASDRKRKLNPLYAKLKFFPVRMFKYFQPA